MADLRRTNGFKRLKGTSFLFDDESSIRRLRVPYKCWIVPIDRLQAITKQSLIRH